MDIPLQEPPTFWIPRPLAGDSAALSAVIPA